MGSGTVLVNRSPEDRDDHGNEVDPDSEGEMDRRWPVQISGWHSDATATDAESTFEGELFPYEVRVRYARLGWSTSGVETLFDHCPLHYGAPKLPG